MKAETPCKAMGYGKRRGIMLFCHIILANEIDWLYLAFSLVLRWHDRGETEETTVSEERFISKIQIYSHEFSTESFFLLIAFCGYLCYLYDLT